MCETSDQSSTRRWPVIQPHAFRNAITGLFSVCAITAGYRFFIVGGPVSQSLYLTIILCTLLFTLLFTLLGESVIEDGVKSAMILFLGCLWLHSITASWCLAPGFSAIIATIVNVTMQATVGRYF